MKQRAIVQHPLRVYAPRTPTPLGAPTCLYTSNSSWRAPSRASLSATFCCCSASTSSLLAPMTTAGGRGAQMQRAGHAAVGKRHGRSQAGCAASHVPPSLQLPSWTAAAARLLVLSVVSCSCRMAALMAIDARMLPCRRSSAAVPRFRVLPRARGLTLDSLKRTLRPPGATLSRIAAILRTSSVDGWGRQHVCGWGGGVRARGQGGGAHQPRRISPPRCLHGMPCPEPATHLAATQSSSASMHRPLTWRPASTGPQYRSAANSHGAPRRRPRAAAAAAALAAVPPGAQHRCHDVHVPPAAAHAERCGQLSA